MVGRTEVLAESGSQKSDTSAIDAQERTAAGSVEDRTRGRSDLREGSARALALYDERFKALLEPDHIGGVVAIHPESGDFAIGKNSPGARRALRQRHREGMIVTMSIGPDRPDPTLDRLLGGQS